jgi:glycosyltransferase involved in cell wall biosynthesis
MRPIGGWYPTVTVFPDRHEVSENSPKGFLPATGPDGTARDELFSGVPRMNWICCQIGAREHYAVARALHRCGALEFLLTDAWLPPGNLLGKTMHGLHERFHKELAKANVSASNFKTIGFELRAKIAGLDGWPQIIARNVWFQRMAVSRLSRIRPPEAPRTLFAFSYAALDLFLFARARGWRTVLGQIDAGPPEERIVARLQAGEPTQRGHGGGPPLRYWEDWRKECALADRVVVNSSWSQAALEEEGVPPSKIRVIPLAYEGPAATAKFQREYPQTFTASRPLRVLFLGSICLRKGVGPLFDAIRLLRGEPVEFWFVGALQVSKPIDLRKDPNVRWFGAVPRSETARFYRNADVFLFPTFSDGFGLTQLEAQAWKLPIITTRFCGDVVEDGRNGWMLSEPTHIAIAAALRRCLAHPERLREFAANAAQLGRFGIKQVGKQWLQVFE